MANAELIKALRYCGNSRKTGCKGCPFWDKPMDACFQIVTAAADALEAAEHRIDDLENALTACRMRKDGRMPKEGEWIMDEHPHDGDCRCSACLIAIDAMHERNHELLNALTGGKWWTFYRYCPNCGARMRKGER